MLQKYRTTVDRLHNYLCNHPNHPPVQLHHSHIDHNKLYKARLICWIYITAIYLWVLWEMQSITTNFIYLTLQGYFITWLFYTCVFQDYLMTKYFGRQNHPCKKFKHYIQIIYQTALCFQFPITLVFWGALFPILLRNNASVKDIILNTNLHLGPLVCLLVDLYYNCFSFPKRHLWVLTIFGTVYLAINLWYSLSVKVIYQPIDWVSVMSYVICLCSYLLTFAAHHFGYFSFKKWKAHKILSRINQGLIQQIQPKARTTNHTQQVQIGIKKISYQNPSIAKKSNNVNHINQGRKDIPTKDNQILL